MEIPGAARIKRQASLLDFFFHVRFNDIRLSRKRRAKERPVHRFFDGHAEIEQVDGVLQNIGDKADARGSRPQDRLAVLENFEPEVFTETLL